MYRSENIIIAIVEWMQVRECVRKKGSVDLVKVESNESVHAGDGAWERMGIESKLSFCQIN